MSDVKQPTDHKAKPVPYKFEAPILVPAKGDVPEHEVVKTFTLPFASKGAEKLTGRDTRDALMNGDVGQLKLGFVMLEACGAKREAIEAMYDLPNARCLEILGEWMTHGDGDGVDLPK
jgi:hypothetical protein